VSYLKFRDGFAAAMDPDFHRIEELDEKVANGSALLVMGDRRFRDCGRGSEIPERTGAALPVRDRGHGRNSQRAGTASRGMGSEGWVFARHRGEP
jgi:hypothetical protein